jgi:hypothetical protein
MFKHLKRVFRTFQGGHRRKAEKGQSLVEVAMLLPLLLIMLAGILDLGRAYMTLVAIKDAAAEGASYAALHPTATSRIVERAADSSNALVQLDTDQVSVQYSHPPTPGRPITVTVSYDYQVLTPILNAIVPEGTLTLTVRDVRSIISD